MPQAEIAVDDPLAEDVRELLRQHLAFARARDRAGPGSAFMTLAL